MSVPIFQVMRRLKEQGELEELRDEDGPGGEALPDTVRAEEMEEATGKGKGKGKGLEKEDVAVAAAKAAGKGIAASVDATVEATVVSRWRRRRRRAGVGLNPYILCVPD